VCVCVCVCVFVSVCDQSELLETQCEIATRNRTCKRSVICRARMTKDWLTFDSDGLNHKSFVSLFHPSLIFAGLNPGNSIARQCLTRVTVIDNGKCFKYFGRELITAAQSFIVQAREICQRHQASTIKTTKRIVITDWCQYLQNFLRMVLSKLFSRRKCFFIKLGFEEHT